MRRSDLILLATLALALRLFAAWAIPLGYGESFNCAPDEAGHFWAARELALGHTATWPESRSIYSAYLPTSYLAHAAAYALLVSHFDGPALYRFPLEAERVRGYPLVRLGSVALSVMSVIALALAAAVWTRSRAAGVTAGLVAALYPQLIFTGAYTNGDAYTVAAGAFLAFALAYWARSGEADPGLAVVAAALAAVVLGKPSGYALLPPTLAWIAWAAARRRIRPAALARALAVAIAIAAPVLAWNAVRNGGDILGIDRYRHFLAGPYRPMSVVDVPQAATTFTVLLATSAFGRFSNMSLPLPSVFFAVALVLLVIGTGAALARLRVGDAACAIRGALWLATAAVLSVALVAWNSWYVDFQPQGRYLLLPAVLLTIVAAWAPSGRGLRWRAWPALYVAFLTAAALATEILLLRHPCG